MIRCVTHVFGSNMSKKGKNLYTKAKKLIPGGTMLLSKRPEMFLPNGWPNYFSKSKGCNVWDLEGKKYLDMSIMGIGTNLLGYGRKEVDEAVIRNIKNGNMSTLSCPEEVELAERLIQINPWADQVRFARSGGEANAIAIRIARAASGRDKVAICGYHGWHDWYLSANLSRKKNLDGHLLPGLNPKGIPRALSGTTIPFQYNDIEGLEKIIDKNKLAAIKMEVSRSFGPENNFLEKVRELADKNNIILIFDECTSGFRECMGGLFNKFRVFPDLAMFGKTLGNGYAITSVVGKQEFMRAAEETFISSTFWTERIGPTAAIETLKIMEVEQPWHHVIKIGKSIRSVWESFSDQYNIPINIGGILPLSSFVIDHPDWLKFKTYITQECLKEGILAANSLYASLAHQNNHIHQYQSVVDPIFSKIGKCINEELDINSLLESPICHDGFKRLN